MKTLRKCIYLILGFFLIGFASCANDSGSDEPKKILGIDDKYEHYTDGFYKYSDGNTEMYLYYENQNLISAGNRENKYTSSQIEILKQSHSWKNVYKYCTKYEVSLSDTWMCGVYPAEKLFKKGWYDFKINTYNRKIGYFESYDSAMLYTETGIEGTTYRTNNFEGINYYSDSTWASLLNQYANSDAHIIHKGVYFLSEDLDFYPEAPIDLDKNGNFYRDGFYEYSGDYTQMYLYYENKSLVSAGDKKNKYTSSQIESLKQSHSWQNIHQYCKRYELWLRQGTWMLSVYPAEKLFQKGWYKIEVKNENDDYYCYFGYFESYDSAMLYTKTEIEGTTYRTNNFEGIDCYSDSTWESLLHNYANSNAIWKDFYLLNENLDYYPEAPSQSE